MRVKVVVSVGSEARRDTSESVTNNHYFSTLNFRLAYGGLLIVYVPFLTPNRLNVIHHFRLYIVHDNTRMSLTRSRSQQPWPRDSPLRSLWQPSVAFSVQGNAMLGKIMSWSSMAARAR